jgi:hypothetical protein
MKPANQDAACRYDNMIFENFGRKKEKGETAKTATP